MSLYVTNYEYSECKPIKGTLQPGKYKFEAWGASAGTSLGGYAAGVILLRYHVPFFIHLGSSPVQGNPSQGGCNGGGLGSSTKNTDNIFGGGGASDIRFFEDTLYHRVLVAGGAGGCTDHVRNACGGGGKECDAIISPDANMGKFGYGGNSTLVP